MLRLADSGAGAVPGPRGVFLAGHPRDLRHLLTCRACRDRATAHLWSGEEPADLRGLAARAEAAGLFEEARTDPPARGGQTAARPLAGAGRAVERARSGARRAPASETAALTSELEAMPAERQIEALAERRFRRRDLVEELLRSGEGGRSADPARAERLGLLAFVLAGRFDDGAARESPPPLRALLLVGCGRRLQGKLDPAAAAFARASALASQAAEEGELLRGLALVRWEQGRTAEASALLETAAELFATAAAPGDEGVCLALAGILATEEGQDERALAALLRARPALDEEALPRLALAARLALALSRARLGQGRDGLEILETAHRLALPQGDGETTWLTVTWAQARIAAFRGSTRQAEQGLTAVRARLFARGRLPEAALATLDLAHVLAKARRTSEIDPVIDAFAARFVGRPEVLLALPALVGFAEAVEPAGSAADAEALRAARLLRKLFRGHGVRIEPPPYA